MPKARLTPDQLLKRIQEEERQEQRGKLKIYLGAAPGVGKTFAMLQDAIAKRAQGLDVVVGVVESHGRKEIEDLYKGLEIIPRQQVDYRDQRLPEFDLDAAIKRNPGLILVDEMAHTNVPGTRHAKRWQDIKELLDCGIDVSTTLNVQHIDSLNDVVSQIIHTHIQETVPDYMLEMAETIELIDLPPEELLKRLQEGKVYFPKQAELAKDHFFRKGNLIALREMALRFTAERVGTQVLLYRQGLGIQHIWPTKEKILVCVGPGHNSTKLIRTARRMASNLQTDWIAVYVDSPRLKHTEEEHNAAVQNLRLAEQLGGETRILSGLDIVKELIRFSREQNINLIIVGRTVRSRLRDMLFSSLADELVRRGAEIEVYVITGESNTPKIPKKTLPESTSFSLKNYAIALGSVALTTIINFLLKPYVDEGTLMMVYLLAVTFVALLGQMGPAILASILSVLAYGYFYILPSMSFTASYLQYFFTLFAMLVVTQVISQLTVLTQQQVEKGQLAERHTAALLTLSRQLASTRGIDKLLDTGVRYLANLFNSHVVALFPTEGHLTIRAGHSETPLNAKEQSVAQWVYDLGQVAGLGTDTLPFSDAIYVPLLASQGTIGVLRVQPNQPHQLLMPEKMHLLEACANQIALAIEVDRLQETKKSDSSTEASHARNVLLQAVSHDLRTPLVAIMGAARTQVEMAHTLEPKKIQQIGQDIYAESEHLNRLINNLLQMSYLEEGQIKLQTKASALKDLIMLAINASYKKITTRKIHVNIPDNLPAVSIDNTLIQEVLINLIDNAVKFTSTDTPIDISATVENHNVIVSVEDEGPGIASDEVNKLFEKFYRGRLLTTERGLGLGLAICRSIIKAHGGEIWAENRAGGGSTFCFTLPLHLTGELKNA